MPENPGEPALPTGEPAGRSSRRAALSDAALPDAPRPGPALPDAVVFDFDGLIVDTETPIYEASRAALLALGHDLTVEAWASVVGHGDADSFAALCRALGADIDRDAFDAGYQAQDRSWRDRQPALPGVVDLLDALEAAAVPCGIASSSPMAWIDGHLTRLGLRGRFATIASVDRVGGRSKPAPDAYLLACADLGARPSRSVAIEDSAPGTMAAHAAGLKVVAVPSHITRHTDTSRADLTVGSVADLTPAALAALLDP
jgi:HAD superfamily hydrolase (TIGR01509 family)